MNGLLKETSEIKKLQQEFKILAEAKQKKAEITKNQEKKLVQEECKL